MHRRPGATPLTDFFFHFSAAVVLPFWAAMIVFPGAGWTDKLVRSPLIILPPIVCYLYFALPHLPELAAVFVNASPETLAVALAEPWAAGMFWAYAGAFDLFVGRWMYLDARERGISHLFVAPALIVAIFLGPVGFTLYALVRALHRRPLPDAPSP